MNEEEVLVRHIFLHTLPLNRRLVIACFVFWEMGNFFNTINYLATQMNNKTSFKQHNKERFIIVAGVKK